jgi:hypothetical protein
MQKYKSEYQPTWKLISKTPPPTGTKILLRMKYGTAVIGQYYEEGGFTHWCGLPKLSNDDKHEMVG